ncbi:MAG: type II toxin-antitoxin system TacA family antitoxin [Methylovirgula sp.]
MSKGRFSSSESPGAAAVAVAERSSASDTKGSINLRIETHTRQLIDDAAAILGKTRTEFMIESARRQAIDVLLDQRLFVLDFDRYDAFMHALDNPPAPGPKLRSLLRRVPAWQK